MVVEAGSEPGMGELSSKVAMKHGVQGMYMYVHRPMSLHPPQVPEVLAQDLMLVLKAVRPPSLLRRSH